MNDTHSWHLAQVDETPRVGRMARAPPRFRGAGSFWHQQDALVGTMVKKLQISCGGNHQTVAWQGTKLQLQSFGDRLSPNMVDWCRAFSCCTWTIWMGKKWHEMTTSFWIHMQSVALQVQWFLDAQVGSGCRVFWNSWESKGGTGLCWRRVTPNLASWVNQQRSEHAYTIVYHIYPKASQCKACNCCEMQEITRSSNYSSLFLWFHIIIMHSPNTKPTRVPSIQSICLGKVVLERICLQYTVSGLWLSQIFFWVMLAKHVRTFVTGIRQSKQRTAISYKDL